MTELKLQEIASYIKGEKTFIIDEDEYKKISSKETEFYIDFQENFLEKDAINQHTLITSINRLFGNRYERKLEIFRIPEKRITRLIITKIKEKING